MNYSSIILLLLKKLSALMNKGEREEDKDRKTICRKPYTIYQVPMLWIKRK